jgi:hypothetical protein
MPLLSFYLLWFFFYKVGEQEGRTDSVVGGGGVGTCEMGKVPGKGVEG